MNTQSLILHLIAQDLKYEQLMYAMREIGFHNYTHSLDLATPVAVLMGYEEETIPEDWMKVYERCVAAYCQYGDRDVEKNARECYEQLQHYKQNE